VDDHGGLMGNRKQIDVLIGQGDQTVKDEGAYFNQWIFLIGSLLR